MKNYLISLVALAGILSACGNSGYELNGKVEGADDKTPLVLESANDGVWYIVDSIKTDKNGEFSYSAEALSNPDIFRIRYNDKSVYFPIDSIDHVTINTNLDNFEAGYTISGTPAAEAIMKVDKEARSMMAAEPTKRDAWKKELAKTILADPSSIVAYYIINKYIGDEPVFDVNDNNDFKIIGAVTNAFNTFRPNDPRTAFLVKRQLAGQRVRRAANAPADTISANVIKIFNINLQDKNGQMQELEKVASKGNVVLLNFTIYAADFSPMLTKTLADIYKKYSPQGFEIYQVALDTDEFQWRQSAKNIPWITVLDPASVQSRNLSTYNVGSVPMSFVINRNGEVVARVEDVTKLDSTIAKYM